MTTKHEPSESAKMVMASHAFADALQNATTNAWDVMTRTGDGVEDITPVLDEMEEKGFLRKIGKPLVGGDYMYVATKKLKETGRLKALEEAFPGRCGHCKSLMARYE